MTNKYLRYQPIISSSSSEDQWLSEIQNNLQSNAVLSKKQDASLFDQLNSIMNGAKPKYRSVDEAVASMQERAGFNSYLKKKADYPSPNEKSLQDSYYDRGFSDGQYDLGHNQAGDILASLLAQKASLPTEGWNDYAAGYGEGAKLDADTLQEEMERVWQEKMRLEKLKKKVAMIQKIADEPSLNTPIVIQKCPQIKNTLENYINDTRGTLPISAIIEKIKSIHKIDVGDDKAWDDENLIRLVSRLNLEAKANNNSNFQNYQHLGKRDILGDSDIDPGNTDAFSGMIGKKY